MSDGPRYRSRRTAAGILLGWVACLMALFPLRAHAQDDWFGPDKVLHFVANLAVTSIAYSVGSSVWEMDRDEALAFGVAVSSAVSIAKEAYDLHTDGLFSGRDLVWDALGMGAAVLLIRSLDERGDPSSGGGARQFSGMPLRTYSRPLQLPLRWPVADTVNPIDTPSGPASLILLLRALPGD